jgi:hypothetical protein
MNPQDLEILTFVRFLALAPFAVAGFLGLVALITQGNPLRPA